MIWPWNRERRTLEAFAESKSLRLVHFKRREFELAGMIAGESLSIWTGAFQLGRDPAERSVTRITLGDGKRADDAWIDAGTLDEPSRRALRRLGIAAGESEERALDIVKLHETAGESRVTVLRPLREPAALAQAIESIVTLRMRNSSRAADR